MSTKKRMTEAEFAAVRPFLKISSQRIDAARAVMVGGTAMTAVGESYGWTKQAVNNAVTAVWVVYGSYVKSLEVAERMQAAAPLGSDQARLGGGLPLVGQLHFETVAGVEPRQNTKTMPLDTSNAKSKRKPGQHGAMPATRSTDT